MKVSRSKDVYKRQVFTQSGFAHLYGQGKVSYPGADLEADVISMDMDNSTVFALSLIHIFSEDKLISFIIP